MAVQCFATVLPAILCIPPLSNFRLSTKPCHYEETLYNQIFHRSGGKHSAFAGRVSTSWTGVYRKSTSSKCIDALEQKISDAIHCYPFQIPLTVLFSVVISFAFLPLPRLLWDQLRVCRHSYGLFWASAGSAGDIANR